VYAVGFHICLQAENGGRVRWKKGTLHDGPCDFQRVVWNLHRRGVPMPSLKTKTDEFLQKGDISLDMAKAILHTIECERGGFITSVRHACCMCCDRVLSVPSCMRASTQVSIESQI